MISAFVVFIILSSESLILCLYVFIAKNKRRNLKVYFLYNQIRMNIKVNLLLGIIFLLFSFYYMHVVIILVKSFHELSDLVFDVRH